MFSPPPGGTCRQRQNIRPYKLAPIQREMFIQEAISDSPFYSTSAQYTSENNTDSRIAQSGGHFGTQNGTRFAPRGYGGSGSAASIPMLIMTDDGGEDWEVGSEVKYRTRCGRAACHIKNRHTDCVDIMNPI